MMRNLWAGHFGAQEVRNVFRFFWIFFIFSFIILIFFITQRLSADAATTDFSIQRGVATITGASTTLTAGVDYVAPSASTSAFIRLTNTHHTGAGDSGAAGSQNADDVTAYIANPWNIENSVIIQRTATPANDTRVAWEIVEYVGSVGGNNEMVVRQQDIVTYGTSALNATATAASGIVDNDDIAVFITGQWNPDTGQDDYNTVLSTSAWSSTTDEAVFTRGEAGGDAIIASYAVVEFLGSNWAVQRAEHTYTATGTAETENISTLNNLTRAFVHVQKRVGSGLTNHADFGHEVWLSGVGQVSFFLDDDASTPGDHTSVAWIIENTQTTSVPMIVTRSNGSQTGGGAPLTLNIDIGKTLSDVSIASIFMNNRSTGVVSDYPEPIIASRLTSSTTQYELWFSNTGDTRNYRTEIVEWPTAPRDIEQNYYRFYVDNDVLDPTDPWPVGGADLGENTAITGFDEPPGNGDNIRIRMTLLITGGNMPAGIDSFKLQYGERTDGSCSGIAEANWHDIGDPSSTTALWRGFDATPVDGTQLSGDPPTGGDLNISVSDRAGTYQESSTTPLTPHEVLVNEDVEFDWNIQHNNAAEKTSYCFRMTEVDGTLFNQYNFYPTLKTVGYEPELRNWRWYDDEGSVTPTTDLAGTNTAPINITNTNIIKLRTTVAEISGATATGTKFKLQFSEYSNFSTSTDVVASSSCVGNSLWCYADGGGVDNATVTATVLFDADACSGGVGVGCGTHNEAPTTTSTHTHSANAVTEFEFTIQHNGARANAVYFFRLYDVVNDAVVVATTSNPSLVTEGAQLVFTVGGLSSLTVTEGITTDADTTSTAVTFGDLPLDTEFEAAQRITVTTNATEGYKIFMFGRQDLLSAGGDTIDSVTGTNASPSVWSTGCDVSADGCYGYHTGDDTLEGGSTRFSANDSYAGFDTTPREIIYSSIPVTSESTDIIYKLQVRNLQPAGQYESQIVYIAVPVF